MGRGGRRNGKGSDDGEPLAALAATAGEDFAAALGGFAGAEADLAGAFQAVRTECRLHGWREKRGSKSQEQAGGVKRQDLGDRGGGKPGFVTSGGEDSGSGRFRTRFGRGL